MRRARQLDVAFLSSRIFNNFLMMFTIKLLKKWGLETDPWTEDNEFFFFEGTVTYLVV